MEMQGHKKLELVVTGDATSTAARKRIVKAARL
jgi:hypothetical protein